MTRNRASFVFAFLLLSQGVFAQRHVHFVISRLPEYFLQDSNLYLAGSFNGWNPKDPASRFSRQAGHWSMDLSLQPGHYEYKITRGGWNQVETKENGSEISNRAADIASDTSIDMSVEGWADHFEKHERPGTASPNVKLVDAEFPIPQLNRKRRVWIYLPPGYESGQKYYPVLYMQDGQNVFDERTAFAGEWGVDEALDSIAKQRREIIVVAIDHGNDKRINEYSPYDMEKYGKGEGGQYVDFLVKTLKPYIDHHYRTKAGSTQTYIAGSSMGGLISMYAVLRYPQVFGAAGVFSPAFWIAPQIFEDIKALGGHVRSRIYFYCGGAEGEQMQANTVRAFEEMRKVSKAKMECVVRPDGKHSEAVWKEEFPLFYLWLVAQ
ncbi:MAG TPA: alpha/beta hydrolase-fold protein [Chitinophagaceae bacterium]